MATPQSVFEELAAKYGNVDADDSAAVTAFYRDDLPNLPHEQIEAIQTALLAADGQPRGQMKIRDYPEHLPLPKMQTDAVKGHRTQRQIVREGNKVSSELKKRRSPQRKRA